MGRINGLNTIYLLFAELLSCLQGSVPDNPKLLLLEGRENAGAGKPQKRPFIETFISLLTRDVENQFHQTYFFLKQHLIACK